MPPPKNSSKLGAILKKQENDPSFRRICTELLSPQAPYAERIAAAVDFLRSFLSTTAVIESHHDKFYSVFEKALDRLHAPTKRIEPLDSKNVDSYVVLVVVGDTKRRGFWSFSYEQVLMWLYEFLLAEPSPLRGLQSITDIPRPYYRWMFDEKKRGLFAPMRHSVLNRILRADSPDKTAWWDKPVASDSELLLLQCDAYLTQTYEDHQAALERKARAKKLDEKPKEVIFGSVLDLERTRFAATLYLHVAYRLASLPEDVLLRVSAAAGDPGVDLIMRLMPLAVNMMNEIQISPCDHGAYDLYEIGNGIVFRTIAEAVEEVRSTLLLVNGKKDQRVMATYARTRDMHQATSLYFDTHSKILEDRNLSAETRWVYSSSKQISFVRLLYQLKNGFQTVELEALMSWLDKPELSERFRVHCGEILNTISLAEAMQKKDDALIASEAKNLRDHIAECDARFSVLRFPPSIRYHEVATTFELLCQKFPRYMNASEVKHLGNEDRVGLDWSSSTVFVGADCRGPFVVAASEQLEMMRQLQLLLSLQTKKHHKNLPVFPLLARFYFSRSVPVCPGPIAFFCDPRPEPGNQGRVDCDSHALHVVVQTMAYWLRLPTEQSKPKKKHQLHSTEPEPPTASAARGTLIPCVGENFFSCFKHMHRFADQLERAARARGRQFPSVFDYNAMADFLELKRPRTLSYETAAKMRDRLAYVTTMVSDEMNEALRYSANALSVALEKKEDKRLELVVKGFSTMKGDDLAAANSWFGIYAPILNNVLPPELVDELVHDSMRVLGREPIGAKTFSTRLYCGSRDAPLGTERDRRGPSVSDFLEHYNACFVSPAAQSHRSLAEEFQNDSDEPVQPLSEFMRGLECLVSAESVGNLIKEKMTPESFDIYSLLEDRKDTEQPKEQTKRLVSADMVLVSDGHSMLPIQGFGHDQKIDFAFYESSFGLALFGGTGYARFMGASRVEDEIDEDSLPTKASNIEPSFGRLLDVVLRCAPQIDLERAALPRTSFTMYRNFVRLHSTLERDPKTGEVDRTKIDPAFRSVDELVYFVDKVLSPEAPASSFGESDKVLDWIAKMFDAARARKNHHPPLKKRRHEEDDSMMKDIDPSGSFFGKSEWLQKIAGCASEVANLRIKVRRAEERV